MGADRTDNLIQGESIEKSSIARALFYAFCAMFAAIDTVMETEMQQMELYCEFGRIVSSRPEKGAAVAAAEYLSMSYPDVSGFSPRNLRRMQDFYRMYQDLPSLMRQAMHIGWTQNVVILEAELAIEEHGIFRPQSVLRGQRQS